MHAHMCTHAHTCTHGMHAHTTQTRTRTHARILMCTHMCTHNTHAHTRTHDTHTCTHTMHTCTRKHTCTYVYVRKHTRAHTHAHARVQTCTHTRAQARHEHQHRSPAGQEHPGQEAAMFPLWSQAVPSLRRECGSQGWPLCDGRSEAAGTASGARRAPQPRDTGDDPRPPRPSICR